MSIDINWEAATSGPDGEALAERIRSFIHDKFQQIALPRFIRSVEVNSFDFGTVSPELQIKDLCDPFEDFYEEDEDEEYGEGDLSDDQEASPKARAASTLGVERSGAGTWHAEHTGFLDERLRGGRRFGDMNDDPFVSQPMRSPMSFGEPLNPYFFPRAGTPGIPGGTSNLGYYMPLGGMSGTQTPLASVPRGPFSPGLRDSSVFGDLSRSQRLTMSRPARRQSDLDIDGHSRPSTADTVNSLNAQRIPEPVLPRNSHQPRPTTDDTRSDTLPNRDSSPPPRRMREWEPEDLQVLCKVKYNGNIRLSITAQVLLDYPMPNFVGLPLKLNITGLTFDGVAVVAYIRKRVHFCFLSPEDANTLLGADESSEAADYMQSKNPLGAGASSNSSRRRDDSLLRDVRVESEIGRKEDGKQVLKNVGKVEKFVLEQVRRIFEEEFVYPSFWTFLV